MSAQSLRQKLTSASSPLLGLCNSYPAPGIIEAMTPGYDLLWIDAQHGQFDFPSTLDALRTAASLNLASLVRVLSDDPAALGQYADLAPDSLMVPMVNTPQQAQRLVAALNFPPKGNRSYGGRRAIDLHGPYFPNTEIPLFVAQIETAESFQNLQPILNTPGVDVVFLGAEDLKLSMGFPIESPAHEIPQVRDAMAKTALAARQAKKFSACLAYSTPVAKLATDMGYHLLIAGSDSNFLRIGATDRLHSLRPPRTL